MLREVVSFLFSMLDGAAIMLLIMSVFRISIRDNLFKMIYSNLLFTGCSMLFLYLGLHMEALLLQIPVMVLIFRYIFNESGKYSIWITITGFVTFLMVQGLLIYMFLYTKVMLPEDIQPFTLMGYLGQTVTFVICSVVSLFLKKTNEGFMFDFENKFNRKKSKQAVTPYMVFSIVLAIFVSLFYPQLYNSSITMSFYLSLFFSVISFGSLIYYSIKRNHEEVNSIVN